MQERGQPVCSVALYLPIKILDYRDVRKNYV